MEFANLYYFARSSNVIVVSGVNKANKLIKKPLSNTKLLSLNYPNSRDLSIQPL